MRMRWFICHYPARPLHRAARITKLLDDQVGSYTSFVWANSFRHARALARRRNIGECVDGMWGTRRSTPYPLTSDLLAKKRLTPSQKIDVVHSVTFLAYLLMQANGNPPCDILGDEGLLHQVIHAIALGRPRRKNMVNVLRYFEARVPGYLPRRAEL